MTLKHTNHIKLEKIQCTTCSVCSRDVNDSVT